KTPRSRAGSLVGFSGRDADEPQRLPRELVGDALTARAARARLYALGRRGQVIGRGAIEVLDRDSPAAAKLVDRDRADDFVSGMGLDLHVPTVPEGDQIPLG